MSKVVVSRKPSYLGRGVVLSLVLHGGLLLLANLPSLAARLLPKLPIQVEFLPPKPKPQPAPPPLPSDEPASPKKPPESREVKAGPPRSSPAKPKPAKPAGPPKINDLAGLGPQAIDQDLGVRVLLRMEPLRKSPHRAAVVKLLSAFPDMSVLVAGTQLAGPEALANLLIDQTQVLLIATADPRDITATVFYALQAPKADVLGKLAGQKGPSWDKRQLQALGPQLLTFARPELLGPGPSLPTGAPPSSDAPPAPSVTTEQWQQRLRDKLLAPGPPLNAEILNMNERVRLGGGLPTPRALRIGISGEDSPSVHVRCELATPADAAKLMAVLPEMKEKLQSRLFWLGLGGLLSQLQLSQQGSAVVLTGKVPGTDADILLQYLAQLLPPPPPGLGLPPAVPTPAPVGTPAPTPPAVGAPSP